MVPVANPLDASTGAAQVSPRIEIFASAFRRMARRKRLAQSEAERRHAIAEKARAELTHGPPMTDQEFARLLGEVEARRQG